MQMPRSQSTEKKNKNQSDTIYHINNEQQTKTDQNQIQASLVKQKKKKSEPIRDAFQCSERMKTKLKKKKKKIKKITSLVDDCVPSYRPGWTWDLSLLLLLA